MACSGFVRTISCGFPWPSETFHGVQKYYVFNTVNAVFVTHCYRILYKLSCYSASKVPVVTYANGSPSLLLPDVIKILPCLVIIQRLSKNFSYQLLAFPVPRPDSRTLQVWKMWLLIHGAFHDLYGSRCLGRVEEHHVLTHQLEQLHRNTRYCTVLSNQPHVNHRCVLTLQRTSPSSSSDYDDNLYTARLPQLTMMIRVRKLMLEKSKHCIMSPENCKT